MTQKTRVVYLILRTVRQTTLYRCPDLEEIS